MKRPDKSPLASKVLLTVEVLMLVASSLALLAFIDTFVNSTGETGGPSQLAVVMVVYFFAPSLVVLSNAFVVRRQWRSICPRYLLFVLSLVANGALVHSCGMHASPVQSVAFGLLAAALACTCLVRIALAGKDS